MIKYRIGFFSLPIVLSIYIGILLNDAGAFRTVSNLNSNLCIKRSDTPGTEDLIYSKNISRYFVSSDDRVSPLHLPGAIYTFDPNTPSDVKMSTEKLEFEFHPHGIGLYEDSTVTRLFVVNHRNLEETHSNSASSTIEIFDWQFDHLTHVETLETPRLITPNAIVPLDKDSFFVSLDHDTENTLLQKIENYSYRGAGSILFFSNHQFQSVATSISFANGLALDHSHTHLAVSSMLGKKIRIYSIEKFNTNKTEIMALRLRNEIPLTFGPDNLRTDDSDTLWVAGHPKLLDLSKHSKDLNHPSPWMISRVRSWASPSPQVETLFSHDGSHFSAVSVAAPYNGRLFLGVIFQKGIFECDLKNLSLAQSL